MEQPGLYLVVLVVGDAARRRRLRRTLRFFGVQVGPDVWEVPATAAGMREIQAALAPELVAGDQARIYPVCVRCLGRARHHGTDVTSHLPAAWVI